MHTGHRGFVFLLLKQLRVQIGDDTRTVQSAATCRKECELTASHNPGVGKRNGTPAAALEVQSSRCGIREARDGHRNTTPLTTSTVPTTGMLLAFFVHLRANSSTSARGVLGAERWKLFLLERYRVSKQDERHVCSGTERECSLLRPVVAAQCSTHSSANDV